MYGGFLLPEIYILFERFKKNVFLLVKITRKKNCTFFLLVKMTREKKLFVVGLDIM